MLSRIRRRLLSNPKQHFENAINLVESDPNFLVVEFRTTLDVPTLSEYVNQYNTDRSHEAHT
jgi:hypothetical protein